MRHGVLPRFFFFFVGYFLCRPASYAASRIYAVVQRLLLTLLALRAVLASFSHDVGSIMYDLFCWCACGLLLRPGLIRCVLGVINIFNLFHEKVIGTSEIIVRPGLINVDFADVREVVKNSGTALIGIGTGSGKVGIE